MSDFDKEAERERLREKYEKEQQKREATEKMSELLLQGATMTNAHCSECGDPIFRYEGQEFCATCERTVDRDGEPDEETESEATDAADEVAASAGDEESSQETIEVTSPDDQARVQFGSDGDAETADATETPTDGTPETRESARQHETVPQDSAGSPPRDGVETEPRERQPARRQTREAERTRTVPSVAPRDSGAKSGGDVGPARDALVQTLTRFSERAEATEDPQRAREYLAAAREAAEALSALRR